MADTWTPIFDLSKPEKTAVFTKTTESEISDIIAKIAVHFKNRHMSPRTPAFTTALFAQPFYDSKARKTSNLRVEGGCIGCGLCEKKCPVGAIKMESGKPVRVMEKCVMCLGCLHRCPKFAIQYGKNTARHGQYTNPNVKV